MFRNYCYLTLDKLAENAVRFYELFHMNTGNGMMGLLLKTSLTNYELNTGLHLNGTEPMRD